MTSCRPSQRTWKHPIISKPVDPHPICIFHPHNQPPPNIAHEYFASEVPPPVQVASGLTAGIKLADRFVFNGHLVLPAEVKVFLLDFHYRLCSVNERMHGTRDIGPHSSVVPSGKPYSLLYVCAHRLSEILAFGTGACMEFVPPCIRSYTKEVGIQLEVMDTVLSPSWRSFNVSSNQ